MGTGIRTLRSLSALRALRLLSSFPESRLTLECALAAFQSTFEVLAFGLLLFTSMALIGMHFFGVCPHPARHIVRRSLRFVNDRLSAV